MDDKIRQALTTDKTIDIITTGAKTGLPRRIEIWFHNLDGCIIICGTPSASGDKGKRVRRDWLANLKASPLNVVFTKTCQLNPEYALLHHCILINQHPIDI